MIDLSLLVPEWSVTQGQVNLSTVTQLVMPVNPRRFAVVFTYINNSSPPDAHVNFAFLTINSNAIQFGTVIQALAQQRYDFPHVGPLVSGEFWARDSGSNVTPSGVLSWFEIVQSAGAIPREMQ